MRKIHTYGATAQINQRTSKVRDARVSSLNVRFCIRRTDGWRTTPLCHVPRRQRTGRSALMVDGIRCKQVSYINHPCGFAITATSLRLLSTPTSSGQPLEQSGSRLSRRDGAVQRFLQLAEVEIQRPRCQRHRQDRTSPRSMARFGVNNCTRTSGPTGFVVP